MRRQVNLCLLRLNLYYRIDPWSFNEMSRGPKFDWIIYLWKHYRKDACFSCRRYPKDCPNQKSKNIKIKLQTTFFKLSSFAMYSVLQQQFETLHCISINGKLITSTNSPSTCNNSIENYHKNLQATSAAAATKCKDKTTTVATTARTTTVSRKTTKSNNW